MGAVSEALECVERARGDLYSFNQLIGHADLLGDACDKLRDAGYAEIADRLESEVIGRNVLHGRWTFQIVEDFDDNYWSAFREKDRQVRDELQQGVRHVFEAEMKERRRTRGKRGHESGPSPQRSVTPDPGARTNGRRHDQPCRGRDGLPQDS